MTSKRLKVGYQMDTAQIKKAAQSLKIQSVNLQSAQTDSEEFVVFSQPEKNTTVRMGRGLASFSCFELLDEEGKTIPAVNFIYQCGLKVVAEGQEGSETEEPTLISIKASFSALYLLKAKLSDECLKEFGHHNVPYHVWPYWREYAQSTLARMGLKPVNIPFYFSPE